MVALTYAVWCRMFVLRARHMKTSPPGPSDFATATAAAMRYFQPVEMPANKLRNLLEMPVLFFALTGFLYATALGGVVQVALAV